MTNTPNTPTTSPETDSALERLAQQMGGAPRTRTPGERRAQRDGIRIAALIRAGDVPRVVADDPPPAPGERQGALLIVEDAGALRLWQVDGGSWWEIGYVRKGPAAERDAASRQVRVVVYTRAEERTACLEISAGWTLERVLEGLNAGTLVRTDDVIKMNAVPSDVVARITSDEPTAADVVESAWGPNP